MASKTIFPAIALVPLIALVLDQSGAGARKRGAAGRSLATAI